VRAENDCYKVKREAAALAGIASLGSDRGPETPAHSSPSNAREGSTGLTPPHRFSYRAPPLASPHSAGRFPGRSKVSRGWATSTGPSDRQKPLPVKGAIGSSGLCARI
jgi:hypothetical protein